MYDFSLPGRRPADEASAAAQHLLLLDAELYEVLVEQLGGEGPDDFLLLSDLSTTWGTDYRAQPLAVHVQRNSDNTFRISQHAPATQSLGAAWLISRGADPALFPIKVGAADGPSDVTSAQIEERMRRSTGRYTVLEHGTEPDAYTSWVMLHDSHPGAAERPVLLQIRTDSHVSESYRLREGSFADPQSAQQWLEDHHRTPLPPVAVPDRVHSQLTPGPALPPGSRASAARPAGRRERPAPPVPPTAAPAASPSGAQGGNPRRR